MKTKKKWGTRAASVVLSASLLIPVLAACSNNDSNADKDKETVLRIASGYGYLGQDGESFRDFTEIFEYSHPNVKLEFVETIEEEMGYRDPASQEKPVDPMEKLKEVMNGPNPPDLVMLGLEHLPPLIEENMLEPLDELITKDKYDTSGIVPTVIEGLKSVGEGKLYALAPQFNASALIYNKDLFDAANITYPTDKMFWPDVFDLARRISKPEGDNPVYGFSFTNWQGGDGFYETQVYSAPLQLSIFNEEDETLSVDTPEWREVWETIAKLKADKVMPVPPDYSQPMPEQKEFNPVEGDLFLSGKLAMSIVDHSYVSQLIRHNKMADKGEKGYKKVNWDFVTMPVHEEFPDLASNIYLNGIFAINAKAQNQDDAWEFIKFINSEDVARAKSRASWYMVSHKEFIKPKSGADYNVEAFYQLFPVAQNSFYNNKVMSKYPRAYEITNLGTTKFSEVISGKKTAEQALKEWQAEGTTLFQNIKENPDMQNEPIPLG